MNRGDRFRDGRMSGLGSDARGWTVTDPFKLRFKLRFKKWVPVLHAGTPPPRLIARLRTLTPPTGVRPHQRDG